MYYVYIIESIETHRWYIGCTSDILQRLRQHNSGNVQSTKSYKPYKLIYHELHKTKTEALKREWQIKKSGYIRQAIKHQIKNNGPIV